MAYLLGIDVSTTATKAVIISEDGQVRASAATEYTFETPHPGWTEQAAALFWEGTVSSIRQALKASGLSGKDIAAAGLTGQMHGMVLLDSHGQPIRPVILWNDQRTAAQCQEITRRVGKERLLELTGNPALTGFTAPKILWTRQHEPENYQRIAHILLPKDYVRYRLSGDFISDMADSSGTSLFNVRERTWSDEILAALDIPRTWLPDVDEGTVARTRVSQAAAEATGLLDGTPLAAGGGDQAAQAVGVGIIQEGLVSVTIGTSGVVFAASDIYRVEPEGLLHAFCHAAPGLWHLMGVMLSAGGSLRWLRDALGESAVAEAKHTGQDPYNLLMNLATQVPAGAEGLLFLPYLTGERTPHPDPLARGVFTGLSLRHGLPHLTRAVIEGVSFGLRDCLELMKALGLQVNEVRASGGGARSPLWLQILADVFNTNLVTTSATEGAAFGAALLAGVSAGVYPNVQAACEQTVQITGRVSPGEEAARYEQIYPRYRALYPALREEFQAMASITSGG